MKYKHCSPHNGRWTFQLNILGHPCRTSAHFDTPEDAAITADLIKYYLRSEFKLDLPVSMDPEQFSSLAYSRRNVDLSNRHSVFQSMPEDVRQFITKYYPFLISFRDASPPETTASKFRRSGMIEISAVREWVEKLEAAESDALAFARVDSASFFLRLSVVEKTLSTAIKSLHVSLKKHNFVTCGTNARLLDRRQKLAALVVHLSQNLDYVKDLTANLREEQALVESYVATLEANRPNLS